MQISDGKRELQDSKHSSNASELCMDLPDFIVYLVRIPPADTLGSKLCKGKQVLIMSDFFE